MPRPQQTAFSAPISLTKLPYKERSARIRAAAIPGAWFYHSAKASACQIISIKKHKSGDHDYSVLTFNAAYLSGSEELIPRPYGIDGDGWLPITPDRAQRLIARYEKLSRRR